MKLTDQLNNQTLYNGISTYTKISVSQILNILSQNALTNQYNIVFNFKKQTKHQNIKVTFLLRLFITPQKLIWGMEVRFQHS
jgi:hypothetical protein